MYKKKDGISAASLNKQPKSSLNGLEYDDATSEESTGLPDALTQVLLLHRPPHNGALVQQALLSHALDGDLAYSTPTLSVLARSITNGLMGSCLQLPFLACYTGWLGRQKQNQRLLDASREFYVHALKETHTALVTPVSAYADSTLAACNALGIYEALECPDGTMNAYHWHRAACYRLVQLRGPEAHQDGAAHRLFTNFRFFGVRSTHSLDSRAMLTSLRYYTPSTTVMAPTYPPQNGQQSLS